jgi:DNA-binding ferritin-like protein
MLDDSFVGGALLELSDFANCVAQDFHCLHFNVIGQGFDSIHGVLKRYYGEAADDFDGFGEWARAFAIVVPNPCASAERLGFKYLEPDAPVAVEFAVKRVDELLDGLCKVYLKLFRVIGKIEDCPRIVGAANFLQTRLEFWTKERCFFNRSRM